jgi:hypothetical protein
MEVIVRVSVLRDSIFLCIIGVIVVFLSHSSNSSTSCNNSKVVTVIVVLFHLISLPNLVIIIIIIIIIFTVTTKFRGGLLEKVIVLCYARNCLHFMKSRTYIPCSREPATGRILCHINPDYLFQAYLSQIHFNILLIFMPGSSKWPVFFMLSCQTFTCIGGS